MDVVHTIQSAVAPVFLISGVGVTIGTLTTRLARIVDRARGMESELARRGKDAADLHASLEVLARRARLINAALTLATLSALLVALVVVLLFADAYVAADLTVAIAILFVGSMVSLTAAFLVFLIEVRIATAALRIGVPP
ncbi:MAG: DUF2721 domain-containing protein [Pseudomonadota bacterium]|jgi:Protein of unknown function (DUF2721).|nr:MAG: DUF2721 domain-containing protein [Pseudomonadota bacterium]